MCLVAGCTDDIDPAAVAELKSANGEVTGRAELYVEPDTAPSFETNNVKFRDTNKKYEHGLYDAASCDAVTQDTPIAFDFGVFDGSGRGFLGRTGDDFIGKLYVIREVDTADGKPGAKIACGPLLKQ